MRSSFRLSLLVLLGCAVLPQVFALEKLLIVTPDEFKAFVTSGPITEVPALFGFPNYRNTLVGTAVYATPHNGCSTLTGTDSWTADPTTVIMAVIDRGGCTFVTKVRNAQNAGARAVLIADNNPDDMRWGMPLMADDGTGSNVFIPSVMMQYDQANRTKTWLLENPTIPNSMSLQYNLPNPDGRVEWDFFTSSWEPQSVAFKEGMIPVVKSLDTYQFFTPHLNVINGYPLDCQRGGCGNQCIYGGHYCAVDPDQNLGLGLSGADVLNEDIRQLCLWDYLNQTYGEGHYQYLWFQYVAAQNSVCYDEKNPDKWRDGVCQNATLTSLGIPLDPIYQCIANSNTSATTNYWLDRMLYDQGRFGIIYLPAAYVNLTPYRGAICNPPITNTGCGLVDMICQGFDDNDIPPVCKVQPASCPFGVTLDCSLTCGTKELDACGSCLAVNDAKVNQSCTDNYGQVCALPKVLDACRVCAGDGSTCSSDNSLSTGAIVGIVFGALVVVGAVAFGVYFYMQYQSKKMREDIDSLLKQYLPLEGGINSGERKNGRLVETASENDL